MSKTIFIDTSRCTACRGCQLACKEWYELPPNETLQKGSHQNPPDLNPNNYKVVRFFEHRIDGTVRWYFFPDQCRHCTYPPCKMVSDSYVEGAILQDETTGAVYITPKAAQLTVQQAEDICLSCPYDVPRVDAKGMVTKCSMCFERISQGMQPVCVTVCPTGAMNFGERADMLALAEKRLAKVKSEFPNASLANPDDVNVIFLLQDGLARYHPTAVAEATPSGMTRKGFLAGILKPFRNVARELT